MKGTLRKNRFAKSKRKRKCIKSVKTNRMNQLWNYITHLGGSTQDRKQNIQMVSKITQ